MTSHIIFRNGQLVTARPGPKGYFTAEDYRDFFKAVANGAVLVVNHPEGRHEVEYHSTPTAEQRGAFDRHWNIIFPALETAKDGS